MTNEQIAKVVYNINEACYEFRSDYSPSHWENAPQFTKDAILNAIKYLEDNPNKTLKEAHEEYCERMFKAGWTWGNKESLELKQQPTLLPYNQLPKSHRDEDHLFYVVVKSLLALRKELQ